jgi:carboxyl-terminal processing protease
MPVRNMLTIAIVTMLSWVCYQKATHNRYASMVSHAMDIIESNYIEDVPQRELFENALHGMVQELDEYSDYIGPDHYQEFQQVLEQEFVGIGVLVEGPPQAEQLRVVSPVHEGPAFRAGVRAGDLILEIDGEATVGMDIDVAVERMKGPPGSIVRLKLQHAGQEDSLALEVKRELIRTKSVLGDTTRADGAWNYFLESDPQIGYVRITSFGEHTANEMRGVLPFRQHPVKALILDLRGNMGGLLEAAVEVCDMFIDQGVIVSTRGRREQDQTVFEASADNTIFPANIPMVVLVDRYSASAAEIVAACLVDHERAIIVGQRSWGKGTVQNVIPLEQGTSALKLTTASYWRPSGTNIHRRRDATEEDDWGVRPSPGFEVPLTDEQYVAFYEWRRARDALQSESESGVAKVDAATPAQPESDPQLQRAIEYLRKQLVPAS